MRISRFIASLFFFCALAESADQQNRIQLWSSDEVFTHVVFGGTEWKTTFMFINFEDEAVNFPVKFYADSGEPLLVPVVGGMNDTVNVALPAKGSVSFDTDDSQLPSGWGWAQMDKPCCPDIGGMAIFRQRIPGKQDSEAVVPLTSTYSDRSVLFFDNSAGYITSVALVNPSSYSDATVTVTIRDFGGNRLDLDQFTMKAMEHTAFALPDKYPSSASQQGTIEFSTNPGSISVLGLRFSPRGSFTSIHSLDP